MVQFRKIWQVGALALCSVLPGLAGATPLTWDVSFVIKALTPADHDEQAYLTFSSDSSSLHSGMYLITSVTGTLDGDKVTEMGVDEFSPANDNLFSPTDPFFTLNGVAFSEVGGVETYKIFEEGGKLLGCWGGDGCVVREVRDFRVPEPTSIALSTFALAALGLSRRKPKAISH